MRGRREGDSGREKVGNETRGEISMASYAGVGMFQRNTAGMVPSQIS